MKKGILLSRIVGIIDSCSSYVGVILIHFMTDVHRFDAHDIPFDGPTGILSRAERLLQRSSHVTEERKRTLLDSLVKIILQNADSS